jgi:signal transduction histidine kinase
MEAQFKIRNSQVLPSASRAAVAVWLLFVVLALSLALSGIHPYYQLLQMPCAGSACLTGQMTAAEAQASLAAGDSPAEYAALTLVILLFSSTLMLITSIALIWRKPGDWAAVCGAFTLAALATSTLVQAAAQANPILLRPAQLVYFVQLAALMPFFCLIPDGRFQPGRLRWVALALAGGAILVAFELVGSGAAVVVAVAIAVSVPAGLAYRYHLLRGSPLQEQVTWALAAMALLAAAQWMGRPVEPLPLPAVSQFSPSSGLSIFAVFGFLLLAGALTCLTVAILSDELFRVEVALNRAIVYSLLTLFVIAAYVLIVSYLSLLFESSGGIWFSLAATGVVAVLFQPVREHVQRFVNTLLYGERSEPYEVIASLGRRLETSFVPEDVLPTIAQLVQESLRLPYVAIVLGQKRDGEPAAVVGTAQGEPAIFPLVYQNTVVGQLLVSPRQGSDRLSNADRALLADLAQQAGVAVHGVLLTAELQRSRERLVLAREEERRRLRRDLHDDLAPALVGLSLRAGTISDLIESDPIKARQLADHLDSAIRGAVGDIRRLVYDLRPPALDDLGLLAAIRERALDYSSAQKLVVVVDAPQTLPPLPAAIEVAAYRIVQEALLNVVKHAHARNCTICIGATETLAIEIVDDGAGLKERVDAGVGLRSIRERTAELGGACEISSGPRGGTQIMVTLPINPGVRSKRECVF